MGNNERDIDDIKADLHATVDEINYGDTSILITSSEKVKIVGCGDCEMDICALLIAVLTDLVESLDEHDKKIVRDSAVLSLSIGSDGLDKLQKVMEECENDSE